MFFVRHAIFTPEQKRVKIYLKFSDRVPNGVVGRRGSVTSFRSVAFRSTARSYVKGVYPWSTATPEQQGRWGLRFLEKKKKGGGREKERE